MKPEDLVHWNGETQLIGWGESDTTGAWIKLRISTEDLEKFRGIKGERLNVTTVLLGNDDQPVDQEKARRVKSGLGTFSNNVAKLCRDEEFQQWLGGDVGEEAAANEIRRVLGIQSRAELDDRVELQARFNEVFRRPYLSGQPYDGGEYANA